MQSKLIPSKKNVGVLFKH